MCTCSKDEPNIYKPKSPAGFGVLIILILIGLNVTALASGGPLESFQVGCRALCSGRFYYLLEGEMEFKHRERQG